MAATPQDLRHYSVSKAVLFNTSPDALNVKVTSNTDNKQYHILLNASKPQSE